MMECPENIVKCTKICVKSPTNPIIFNEKLHKYYNVTHIVWT